VIRTTATGVELDVRVIPRAKTTTLDGEREGALLVRLAASPVEGAANEALIRYFSERLRLPRHAVRIIGGVRGRKKRVAIDGITADSMRELIRGSDVR
jgi:uncharacterized protein